MRSNRFEYALLAGTAVLFSTLIAGAQFFADRGLSLFEISFFPLLGTSILLLPFAIRRGRKLSRHDVLFFIGYGLTGALLNLTQFGAVVMGVPIAMVVFLIYTEPAWTVLLSRVLLREKIPRRSIVAVLIALVGVLLMAGPSFSEGFGSSIGLLLALAAGLCFSLWIVIGRKREVHRHNYTFEAFCFGVSATLWLLVMHPFLALMPTHEAMRLSWSFSPLIWIFLLAFAFISDALPNVCFYRAIERVKASTAGIILLLEPVAAAMIGTLIFGQEFTVRMALGGVLILAANVVIVHRKK